MARDTQQERYPNFNQTGPHPCLARSNDRSPWSPRTMKRVYISLLLIFCGTGIAAEASAAGTLETVETINVAEHGIVPGKDVTFAVNALLDSIKNRSNVTLVFPKGQYDFYPDNALEQYRAIANHDNGLKKFGLPLFDCKNITIDGGDSTFLFHGRMVPITIERADGATLRNFTVDWVRSFHAELKVVESGSASEGFVVETDPAKYPYQITGNEILFERYGQLDPIGSNIVIDATTNAPIVQTIQTQHKEGKNHGRTSRAIPDSKRSEEISARWQCARCLRRSSDQSAVPRDSRHEFL